MPMYEFVCSKCGQSTEKLRKMGNDTPPETCPHCNEAGTMHKYVSSNTSFNLKGRGWHKSGMQK